MKRKFVQIAALCLTAALFLAGTGGRAAAVPVPAASTGERIIRVGLHFGTGAMEGLNMANVTGSGFRFGYYDSANQFVELGSTSQRAISVVETMNVWYGTYNKYSSYHTAITSSVAVGEYHLELPGAYGTFAEAQAAASLYPDGFPACIGGTFYARIGNYTTRDGAVAAQSALSAQGVSTELRGTSAYGVSVVITGTSTILFQYDDLGRGTGLGVEPSQTGGGEKWITLSMDQKYNGGFRFERIDGGKMTVVNIVGLEDYVKGVVATEMSESWPMEALKAQAVAARSYALSLGAKHAVHHFDICYDVDCQAYTGQTRAGTNTNAAVDQTAGQVMLCDGQIAQAYYYSSNGGASESVSNVWGSNQALYPYLVGKPDPYEPVTLNNNWERTFTSAQLISRVLSGYRVSGSIVSAAVTAYTDVGNVRMVTFTDSAGNNYSVTGKILYRDLGLPSFRFGFAGTASQPAPPVPSGVTVNGDQTADAAGLYAIDGSGNLTPVGDQVYVITDGGVSQLEQGQGQSAGASQWASSFTAVNGSITFAGKGWGHTIGMSQFGAKAMAEQGYTYDQILQFYYTGITVGYT